MSSFIPSASKSRSMMMAVMLGAALASSNATASTNEKSDETLSAQTVWDIARYCQMCWKNARLPIDHWEDCTQQVLARLLERVSLQSWGQLLKDESQERREFFRAIDTVKKRSQRSKRHSEIIADLPDRHHDGPRSMGSRHEHRPECPQRSSADDSPTEPRRVEYPGNRLEVKQLSRTHQR
jgi:hypothetical protein